ncbi:MAG TPA: DUF1232 domain-containing protein [Gaiellaceae bacterium]|jgi:uncharacterized membrane protein YkvA (DUF1232 family)
MPAWFWLLILCGVVAPWLGLVVYLLLAGRTTDARALAGFAADCVVLTGRLLRDARVPRRRKLLLAGLAAYLALPFDLIPDVIPGAGQLDDLVAIAVVLRGLVRGGGEQLIREHWPGPDASLKALLRIAGV